MVRTGVLVPRLVFQHVGDPLIDDEVGDRAEDGSHFLNPSVERLEQFLFRALVIAHVVEGNALRQGAALHATLALFQDRGVPRQIKVDEAAQALQIQAGAGGIRADQQTEAVPASLFP